MTDLAKKALLLNQLLERRKWIADNLPRLAGTMPLTRVRRLKLEHETLARRIQRLEAKLK